MLVLVHHSLQAAAAQAPAALVPAGTEKEAGTLALRGLGFTGLRVEGLGFRVSPPKNVRTNFRDFVL